MATYRTVDFWAPALYANTLEEVCIPEPGPSRDPIVRHLPIKHGEYEAVGVVKRMIGFNGGLMAADDAFRISTLALPESEADVPSITSQALFPVPPAGSTWTGLAGLSDGVAVSSLASGRVSLHRADNENGGGAAAAGVLKVGKPVLTLSAPTTTGNVFAMAGKEMEISVWDVERAFPPKSADSKKRKKDSTEMMPGEVWRAKNVPHNNLQLRVPVHHLCSAFLRDSTTDIVTGTKAGNVRRYDTRQRKPTADWKLAREGGVAAIAAGNAEHEVFFADHSNLVGALDLRTGKMLYSISGLNSTAHFLLPLPAPQPAFTRTVGLATVSSDAMLRLCGTTPPPVEKVKGNWATGGKKGVVVGSVGGVGVASAVFRGFGSHTEVVPEGEEKEKKEGEEGEEDDDDEEVDEEQLWEGMDEAEARSDEEDEEEDWESSDEEEEAPKKQKTRK